MAWTIIWKLLLELTMKQKKIRYAFAPITRQYEIEKQLLKKDTK